MKSNQMMEKGIWVELCKTTASEMRGHVLPFTTPISLVKELDYGEHNGTGSYINFNDRVILVTNEHVTQIRGSLGLTHKFWDCDEIYAFQHPCVSIAFPVDVSASIISQSVWDQHQHKARAIPLSRFEKKHSPVEGELLFFAGFSGDRSQFLYDTLVTFGTPYLTQETAFPNDIDIADDRIHFALPYKPDKAISVDGSSSLPRPPGFSGSLVWDTKRVASYRRGEKWSPELATVTGIVWGWPSSAACILATRVEHLNIKALLGLAERYG